MCEADRFGARAERVDAGVCSFDGCSVVDVDAAAGIGLEFCISVGDDVVTPGGRPMTTLGC